MTHYAHVKPIRVKKKITVERRRQRQEVKPTETQCDSQKEKSKRV